MILQQSSQKSSRTEVKGLTSAVTSWLAAGLGAAAGCGLWRMSLVGTLMTLVILSAETREKDTASAKNGDSNSGSEQ
jgi:putative Mg2+ transporter-C (MgtC) family protein